MPTKPLSSPKQDSETVEWLLELENPSVRFRALQDLKGHSAEDPIVKDAALAIEHSNPVKALFSYQQPDGSWEAETWGLWSVKGTVFSLLLLGELGVNRNDQTDRALDYIHDGFQLDSGLIDHKPIKTNRRRQSQSTYGWCITPIALRAALLLRSKNHPLVTNAINFLETFHEEQGGWQCNVYSRDSAKVRPRNCYMGTIKVLSALSLIPPRRRTKRHRQIIQREITTCLENSVNYYRLDRKGQPAIKRAWSKFAFPRNWKSDTLEATDVLTSYNVQNSALEKALDLIEKKRQPNGRWLLDFSTTKRAWIQLEEEGAPSKWVTLRALRTLQKAKRNS